MISQFMLWPCTSAERQAGQAMVEALVALSAMLFIWAAVAWLGRYQDIALQATHASRYAAFAEARGERLQAGVVRRHYFVGARHRWADRRGRLLIDGEQVGVQITRGNPLGVMAQPGRAATHGQTLREQWGIADTGLVDARVSIAFSSRQTHGGFKESVFMSGLRDFDQAYPKLVRHTAILANAGHAVGEIQAQQRVADSTLAWGRVAQTSYGLTQQINTLMSPVDAAWRRPQPERNWLSSWAGDVPERHLHSGGEP